MCPETGDPLEVGKYKLNEANQCVVHAPSDCDRLIEEYMLLANTAVAERLYQAFPQTALLRRHPEPDPRMAANVAEVCAETGVAVNTKRCQQRSLLTVQLARAP